ncbi:uncharacterized protein CDV56_101390 [Aspergillus thermomutatus]|uniref:Uncharacterized protein n=1 Tax=Aspergillus thermomutatus TaxID=41047 RepID=A0A397GWB5_ASPTH|nr:uncharacterized protein CDV56_101390 [Aspergillus thermomutatus]RHZ53958.1 hypothetical protein CDV56_101390 [Aspergillus thermomutatus]
MSEVGIKIKLTGYGGPVARRLRALLKDCLTNSGDPDLNPQEAGQRSVELELEIARRTTHVIKKEKKVMGLREAMAYINSTCERSQALLAFYFPSDDYGWENICVTLTLKVIMKSLLMNTNSPAKSYVEIKEDVLV